MSQILHKLKLTIKNSGVKPRIIFVEGWNEKIQASAQKIKSEGMIEPVLLLKTQDQAPNYEDHIETIVIDQVNLSNYSKLLYDLRKEKGMTIEKASELVTQPNYLATLIVKNNEVDGMVCGIEYTTKDTLLPALQIVKTCKSAKIVSSIIVLENDDDFVLFSDPAININPNSEQHAEIAKNAGWFAKDILSITKPKIAMLSYSTAGSGVGESVDKVVGAIEIIKQDSDVNSNFDIYDSEIQFDAAYDDAVREKKAKTCEWTSKPDIFVFPNIDAGNIGYKIAQRMGGYAAFGPALIGLGAPINDLSRGASIDDVIGVSYLTAVQAIKLK